MSKHSTVEKTFLLQAKSLEDQLTCPVCLEAFGYDEGDGNNPTSKTPQTLPCLHSVCSTCLPKIAKSRTTIRCPVCKQESRLPAIGASGVPKNFVFNELLKMIKKAPQRYRFYCQKHDLCELQYCETCASTFCEECGDDKHVPSISGSSIPLQYLTHDVTSYATTWNRNLEIQKRKSKAMKTGVASCVDYMDKEIKNITLEQEDWTERVNNYFDEAVKYLEVERHRVLVQNSEVVNKYLDQLKEKMKTLKEEENKVKELIESQETTASTPADLQTLKKNIAWADQMAKDLSEKSFTSKGVKLTFEFSEKLEEFKKSFAPPGKIVLAIEDTPSKDAGEGKKSIEAKPKPEADKKPASGKAVTVTSTIQRDSHSEEEDEEPTND